MWYSADVVMAGIGVDVGSTGCFFHKTLVLDRMGGMLERCAHSGRKCSMGTAMVRKTHAVSVC